MESNIPNFLLRNRICYKKLNNFIRKTNPNLEKEIIGYLKLKM